METKEQILQILKEKSLTKQHVFDRTLEVFNTIKILLEEGQNEYNKKLGNLDSRIHLDYKDNGKFEAQLKVAGDLLIFSMHSNAFEFNREHNIWKTPFAQKDTLNTYCGIIHIYNFLSDSFRYQRDEDLGYLIGRIFINKDLYFMVEGKRQLGYLYNMFGQQTITKEILKDIINNTILYALEFDLLVPPYDAVKIASVAQMNQNIENSKLQTAKRLGFKFNSDDVGAHESHQSNIK
jgi:hypothetical protein